MVSMVQSISASVDERWYILTGSAADMLAYQRRTVDFNVHDRLLDCSLSFIYPMLMFSDLPKPISISL